MHVLACVLLGLLMGCATNVCGLPLPGDGGFGEQRERRVSNVPTPFNGDTVDLPAVALAPAQPQPQQSEASKPQPVQPQVHQFLWPYPPAFDPYLPLESKQQLLALYIDTTLTPEERSQRVNQVFDALPLEIVSRLPLPEGYERLPADVYSRIMYVHTAPSFRWAERQEMTREIIESLPEEQRRQMGTRLDGPPPGFERVLAPSVYKQLLAVHYNHHLTKLQKSDMITRIMRQVPQEQIARLPLPAGFDQTPMEIQQRLRALVYDYTVPQRTRAERVRDFVQRLPEMYRPPLRR